MEVGNILKFMENKSILVIGATGFLAKVFIEKILRVQQNVKKVFVLIRAPDSDSALHRFNTEVMAKELFSVLKEKYGENLDKFLAEKVSVIMGDITRENLGIEDYSSLLQEVEIVINSAATTDFDGRYDIAFGINTIGALRVLDFARRCSNLRMLLHVSTAYVCGEKEGIILETPFSLEEILNGTCGLDIDVEQQIIEEKLRELRAERGTSEKYIYIMKDLGTQRANKYGWPNSYVFTKAMGEMLLGHHSKDSNMPLVIIRPTIITSTYKEPFPGWIEGVKSIDSFIVGYGKGKMSNFIPADMVVNSMIVAMVKHADQPTPTIYHVGSSMRNPILYGNVRDYGFRYFTERPWIDNDGNAIIVHKGIQLRNISIIRIYMLICFLIPLQMLNILNTASCQYFQKTYLNRSRKVKFLIRFFELFRPYVFFKGVFDDKNTEDLRKEARENDEVESEMFYFDPRIINWDSYFMSTHIAAVVKYGFKR